MRSHRFVLLAAAVGICLLSTRGAGEARLDGPRHGGEAAAATTEASGVRVDFQNVNMHVAPGAVLEVHRLQGMLVATRHGEPPTFDDIRSYRLQVDRAEVAMSGASLEALLNRQLFSGRDAPLSEVSVTIEDGQVKQSGKLRKGISIPVATAGEVSATGDGRIRLHPTSIKAAGVPAGGVLNVLHLRLDRLIAANPARGFTLDGNDMLLDPSRLLPDPQVTGRVTAVRVEGNRLVQTFGTRPASGPERDLHNYMHYMGHVLRFGRLTMNDTDLTLIDQDPKDPLEFSPAGYVDQLVAGYSKNAADGSVRVYVPDLNDLPARPASRRASR